jgi:aryl-alcohol dehydrogenase-like predicted oxidoreductase
VIAGATRPEQVEANVAACLWEPSAEDLTGLGEVNTRRGAGMRHASYALR